MSVSVWPSLPPKDLKKAEEASTARELKWLLESMQESLRSLKSGLEEIHALLAPVEPGSTLVVSSPRSEAVKGTITRVGTRIVKGSLTLRLRTHAPISLQLSPANPILLQPLITLRNLLNQALDCVDITRWTGDQHSATFISAQLRLLHQILAEARSCIQGTPLIPPPPPSATPQWATDPLDPASFNPALPESLSIDLSISDASLILTFRTLEDAEAVPDLKSRFAFAIGAARRLEHDEMDQEFSCRGLKMFVREKYRVESADPSLMAAMAKLAALEHAVGMSRWGLAAVMGEEMDDV